MEQLQIFLVVFPEDARALMSNHLAFTKWKECCFSTDQLKTTRWLLGARPKNAGQAMAEYLTVTPLSQTMLMELHIKLFNESARKVKPSARNRIRASCEDFEKLVDYACMFAALRNAAKLARCDSKVDGQLVEAFLSKLLGFFGSHYITSSQTRIVEIYIVDIQQTVKVKLAADCEAMANYNLEKSQAASKSHVLKVLHEKKQNEIGKQFLVCITQSPFMFFM